ncbi:antibiotic biosynthesis monooxygenase [Luteibacter rhizovicinus]|uniref:Antibiotic biosynthesis monooxygenase n=1 Tax=Luteibacter rhizovicinus TaxID=242606 RepID=A0A4R3YTL9_9GAMM|nr:antibiotic biosynthesis monooxygenase [Luteibacter rhizovicinus]TCV96385.1 antibiotic biosynthesis monooxygenase [Luteibacter rhizovicinus]
MPRIGFVVLYRWRVHAGMEESFVEAWSRISEGLLTRSGSLGSRLHKGEDGVWYSYAQWPSKEARELAFSGVPADVSAIAQIEAAIAERLPEINLEPVSDFLVSG